MKVLLLGSGGRESALARGLARSTSVSELVVAPGNPGIGEFATTVAIDPEDPTAAVGLTRRLGSDLVVIGPEAPLVAGVPDAMRAEGIKVFGPSSSPARIEASKSFAKEIMSAAGITVPAWGSFSEVDEAIAFMDRLGPPYVVKADGLAAGKGVVVTEDRSEAAEAIRDRIERDAFGDAGQTVVIEEFLRGEELSLIAFTDGRAVIACEPAQDYKRVFDGDAGPNTGGMGSYSPVPMCSRDLAKQIVTEVLEPVVAALRERDPETPFVGALYAGLVLTDEGPRILEFNARFGDPETQALIPRLRSDLGEVCLACAEGDLQGTRLEWDQDVCVCVVLASKGYPGSYQKGLAITGLEAAEAIPGIEIFHAGTARSNGTLTTAGGRVLGVSARAPTFAAARSRAYEAASLIEFEGKHLRQDIALKAEDAEEGS